MMNSLPDTTAVAIVGAGPTGLTLACVLAARRIPFVLLDQLAEGTNTSRAAVIHPRTLEVLDELKVTDMLHAEGHRVPRFTIRDRDRVLATIPFDGLPTRYPYTLMVPQQVTEEILLKRLRALGGDAQRPFALESYTQNATDVSIRVADTGSRHTVHARYLVGADGMHSRVREQAGIGFHGDKYAQSFVLADVRMAWPLASDEVMLFFAPEGLVVVAPLPGGRHRIVATLDEAPEHPSVADLQHLLDTRGPTGGAAHIHEIVWGSRFRVHHRLADAYRSGRVLLAGDAAHVHSPAGGQGMNTGIQDAVALGRALADVVEGADESLLDGYERQRRPVAERVVNLTHRMTGMATLQSRRGRMLRNAAISLVGRTGARHWLASELSGVRNRPAA